MNSNFKAIVVIPAYNCKEGIGRCVESYLNQTYKNVDIIIVNDGSTDGTDELCEDLSKNHTNVIYFSQTNQGVSSARNRGIDEAEKCDAKYLFFADSDDYAESELIGECISAVETNNVEFAVAGYYFDAPRNDGTCISIKNSFRDIVCSSKDEIRSEFTLLWDTGMMYNIWNKLFFLDVVKKEHIRFPGGKAFNEDRDFVREYMRHTDSLVTVDKCLYHYNRTDDTATGIYRADFYKIRREEYVKLKGFFEEYGVRDESAHEFLARQHTDRVVGVVENMFHDSERTTKKIKNNIKNILDDPITDKAFKIAKPKSKKMKILTWPYKVRWIGGIYCSTALIYYIKEKNPQLFHKLRQTR